MKDVVKSLTGSYHLGLDSSTNSEVFIRKYDIWVEVTKDHKLRLQLQPRMKFLFGQWKVGIARSWASFENNDEKSPMVVQSTEDGVDVEEGIMPLTKGQVPWRAKSVSLGWRNHNEYDDWTAINELLSTQKATSETVSLEGQAIGPSGSLYSRSLVCTAAWSQCSV
jgi:hypothetical protein